MSLTRTRLHTEVRCCSKKIIFTLNVDKVRAIKLNTDFISEHFYLLYLSPINALSLLIKKRLYKYVNDIEL